MKRLYVLNPIILLTLLCLTLLVTACSSEPAAPTATATDTAPVPTPSVSGTDEATGESAKKGVQDLSIEELAAIAAERTPVPSPTPGPVDKMVEQVATESGLAGKRFLALTTENWINLAVSALIVLIGSLLVIPLLFGLLRWAVRRTKTQFDDDFLATVGPELRWLVVIIITRWAVFRLDFLSDGLRGLLDDLFFLLVLGILYIIALRLVSFAADRFLDSLKAETDGKRLAPIITPLRRLGYFLVSLIALNIATGHFGINTTLLTTVIVFLAVVIALAGRSSIDDVVGGFVILFVQPFRVGDDILIKDLNTWGSVVKIGLLTTSLHTRDNRLVTIPNAQISQSQVVNYTDPDPAFRVQIDFLALGGDLGQLQHLINETVRRVEGVLPDRPVDVLYLAFGGSSRELRVRWWVEDVNQKNLSLNRVNAALERALAEAGIDTPDPTYALNLKSERDESRDAAQAVSDGGGNEQRLQE
jgi:small conductance mechanosensitive channel